MKIRQVVLSRRAGVSAELAAELAPLADIDPQLLLVFGDGDLFTAPAFLDAIAATFPEAVRLGCSTAGEIATAGTHDASCVVTAVAFEHGSIKGVSAELPTMGDSFAAGKSIGERLAGDGLRAVLVYGRGTEVNGSALLRGMATALGDGVAISGGLAGDGTAFQRTWTLDNAGVSDHGVVAVGLYGEHLVVSRGSFGGWQAFGPARKVTRSVGNVLAELDGEPALAVYKRYLGDHAKDLPGSGLLFPFLMLDSNERRQGLIRTTLGVDDAQGTVTLAGEIDPGGYLKLMHASTDALVDGAEAAARDTLRVPPPAGDSLAILVSCVGRKLVMGDRVDEEVEAVAEVLGDRAVLAGFYSYGEFGPLGDGPACMLHNQTMTVTRIGES